MVEKLARRYSAHERLPLLRWADRIPGEGRLLYPLEGGGGRSVLVASGPALAALQTSAHCRIGQQNVAGRQPYFREEA